MMLSVIVMKLDPTTGIIPSLNVAFGLLSFFIKLWTKVLEHTGVLHVPFTRQENAVIQTCIVTAYGLAFSGALLSNIFFLFMFDSNFKTLLTGGYGNYLLGMSLKIAGQTKEANDPLNIKDPKLGWMIVCRQFVGLFSVTPLRKVSRIKQWPNDCVEFLASGLMCGDGVWSLPQAVLALLKVKPPICMKFLSRQMNERFDTIIKPAS
ncbi:hypothetical protein ZIOFF_026109 [Zingiber officinale]|uniref:Uncharacterized protein n=1 Tax=Zingiber officinale TaxID=94328 RepID=A0A8J5GWY0_ZINOF|nr:hypothetical protein ZIOFF_026109 [Zingiber officinale]